MKIKYKKQDFAAAAIAAKVVAGDSDRYCSFFETKTKMTIALSEKLQRYVDLQAGLPNNRVQGEAANKMLLSISKFTESVSAGFRADGLAKELFGAEDAKVSYSGTKGNRLVQDAITLNAVLDQALSAIDQYVKVYSALRLNRDIYVVSTVSTATHPTPEIESFLATAKAMSKRCTEQGISTVTLADINSTAVAYAAIMNTPSAHELLSSTDDLVAKLIARGYFWLTDYPLLPGDEWSYIFAPVKSQLARLVPRIFIDFVQFVLNNDDSHPSWALMLRIAKAVTGGARLYAHHSDRLKVDGQSEAILALQTEFETIETEFNSIVEDDLYVSSEIDDETGWRCHEIAEQLFLNLKISPDALTASLINRNYAKESPLWVLADKLSPTPPTLLTTDHPQHETLPSTESTQTAESTETTEPAETTESTSATELTEAETDQPARGNTPGVVHVDESAAVPLSSEDINEALEIARASDFGADTDQATDYPELTELSSPKGLEDE